MVQPRKSAKERRIEAPVLALQLDKEVQRLKTEPEWQTGKEDGITLAKYPHLRVVLVALRKGASMHEHTVRGPISVFVVSGRVTLLASERSYDLRAKGLATLRKSVLHDVRATEDSVILLTVMAL